MSMSVGVVLTLVNLASAAVLFIFTLYTHAVPDVSFYLTHAKYSTHICDLYVQAHIHVSTRVASLN